MAGNTKKAIVTKTGAESSFGQVSFQPQKFNALVFNKGYKVYIDKALRCPCSVKGAGQPLVTCDNCLGIGWIYINRKETIIAIQGITAKTQYENWSKLNTGMAKVTARAVDRLSFMDRIILIEAEGYHNEILRPKDFGGKKVCFTTYEIKQIESIFLFKGDKVPLYSIPDTEYTIENEKIILSDKYKSLEDTTITVRYKHLLTYHVIDMNRDVVKVRTKDNCHNCDNTTDELPVSCTVRKAHYLFDNLSHEQASRLIDNTDM